MAHVIKIGGMWYADFRYKGKRYRRALSRFKAEADLLLPDLVRSVRGLKFGESRNLSWQFFRKRYLEHSQSFKTANTLYKDTYAFDLVDRHADLRQLSQMTPDLLDSLKMKWEKAGETPSIVTRSVKAIKTAMRKAEDWKYVAPQNWRTVKVVEPGGRMIHYTMGQFEALLKVCPPAWKMAAMLQGRAGLRSGEAYILQWPDVDFERRRLHIYSRPGWRIKGDQKGNAEKWIPIEPDLCAFLAPRRKREGFLIDVEGYGKRMSANWFLNKFKKLLKKAKLPGSPHALRHTCASMMVSNGASLEEVAGVLGHKNLKTSQIYAHLSPDAMVRAVGRLPRIKTNGPKTD